MTSQFIRRPVLAIILSLMLVFLGLLAMRTRPVSQFPEISPPRVMVSLTFPGASADVLVQSSIITLERAINGVPGMNYMISDSTSAGEATIQVVFALDADPKQAIVNVKNRVDQVINRLPTLVQLEGVIVNPVQPSMLMYVNLYSSEKSTDQKFLYNFANANLLPELSRVDGVSQTRILGSRQYAMRVWLNPEKMRAYSVSTEDVMKSISEQSVIGSPGRLGQATGKKAQSLEYVLTYKGRFNKPEQYENIIIRANEDGEMLRLRDIAQVELGSEFFDIYSNLDGNPSAAIVLKQTYGSNASDVIADVKAKLDEIKKSSFPAGMDYEINYDVSTFLDASIEKVLHTLGEAFLLVALVVFIFLGDWRSTLIPILAVPVSLVGTFVFMQVFGITINLITLFALVLSIGIVVDNAIVVVEAVHVKMAEQNMSPYNAVTKVVGEISGAVIAITLMMTAVFVPVAFMTGPVGIFYRQFAITMAAAIVLSGVVALTLTPVLCAMILKSSHGQRKRRTPIGVFLDLFNRGFEKSTNLYTALLERIVNRRLVTFVMLVGFGAGVVGLNRVVPAGFVPNEDQGMIYAIIQTPPGTTLERTNDVSRELQEIAKKVDGVDSVSSLAGYEILTEGRGSNAGTCLINLKGWSKRTRTVTQIIEQLEKKAQDIGAVVEFFEPPPVPGYGAASGFALRLLDNLGDFRFGLTGSWEVDIWKKLRNAAKAAGLRYLATIEARNFVATQIVAEIARSYYELIALDSQIDILKSNIEVQANALEVVKLQKQAARVTELAVQRFEAEVLKNKSRLYNVQQERVQAENRINFLVGRYPQPVARSVDEFKAPLPDGLQAGLPSQLLENRPDVRAAALELQATKLDVQVAKAAFYPSLSIDAELGYRSFNAAHLVNTPESLIYNVAGNLTAPLLNRTAITAQYRTANAKQLQAVFNYEKILLQAFTDVANQLSMIDNLQKSYDLQSQQVDTLARSVEISGLLFRAARADYMEVLLTRRDSLEAQMERVETKKKQFHAMVNIYQALGGGWRAGS